MARCVWPSVLAFIAVLHAVGLRLLQPARSGRSGAPRPKTPASPASSSPHPSIVVPIRRDRRPRHLRHDPPAESLGARGRQDRARQGARHRLPDDPGAGGLAQRHRSAGRPGPLRPEGRDRQRVRRLQLPLGRQHRGRAALRARLRQCGRRGRLHARRRADARHSCATGRGPTLRRPPFCTRRTPAPASISPPCSGRARTSSTTTTSISISPITARPTPARAGSASRRPRRALLPAPASPDGLPPAPDIEEPLDIARAGNVNAVALAPASAIGPDAGPDVALPPATIGETDPAPPVLPAGAGPSVDPEPTSSIGEHDE